MSVRNVKKLSRTKKSNSTTKSRSSKSQKASKDGTNIQYVYSLTLPDGKYCAPPAMELKQAESEKNEKPRGNKNDQGKPPIAMISSEALRQAAMASAGRDATIDKWNYKLGIEITRTVSGAMRHILDFMDGIDVDPKSKATSLGSAIFNLAMAIDTLKNHPELDDRFKGVK
jgi:hypothetical protein